MDASVALLLGGSMILVGFLSMIRFRFARARQRLNPAASIRSRAGSSAGYSSGGNSFGRSISVLLMLGGGVVVVAGVLS